MTISRLPGMFSRRSGLSRSYLLISALGTATSFMMLLAWRTDNVNILVWLILLCILGYVPIYAAIRRGCSDLFEPINLIILIYFVAYGLRALYVLNFPALTALGWAFDKNLIRTSLLYSVLGTASLVVGYYWSVGHILGKKMRRWFRGDLRSGALRIACAIYVLGVGARVYLITQGGYLHFEQGEARGAGAEVVLVSGVHNIMSHIGSLGLYAFILVTILYYRRTREAGGSLLRGIWCVMLALETGFAVLSGSRGLWIANVLLPIFIIRHYMVRRLSLRLALSCLIVLSCAYLPIMTTYRELYWSQLGREDSTYKMPAPPSVGQIIDAIAGMNREQYVALAESALMGRAAFLDAVALVVRDTPGAMDFQNGRTLGLFLFAFVPRALWPEKPGITLGVEWAQAYWQKPMEDLTNVGVTAVGEWYLNFHVPGILLGMFLFGVMNRLFYDLLIDPKESNPLGLFLYAGSFSGLVALSELNLAAGMAGLIQSMAVMYLVFLAAREKRRA